MLPVPPRRASVPRETRAGRAADEGHDSFMDFAGGCATGDTRSANPEICDGERQRATLSESNRRSRRARTLNLIEFRAVEKRRLRPVSIRLFLPDHAAARSAGFRVGDGARRGSVAAADTRNHRNHRPAPNADLPQRRLRREVHRSRKRRRRVRVSPGTAHLPRTQKRMGVLRPDEMGLRRVPEDTDVRGGETLREPGERGGVREDERSEEERSGGRRVFVLQYFRNKHTRGPGRW